MQHNSAINRLTRQDNGLQGCFYHLWHPPQTPTLSLADCSQCASPACATSIHNSRACKGLTPFTLLVRAGGDMHSTICRRAGASHILHCFHTEGQDVSQTAQACHGETCPTLPSCAGAARISQSSGMQGLHMSQAAFTWRGRKYLTPLKRAGAKHISACFRVQGQQAFRNPQPCRGCWFIILHVSDCSHVDGQEVS